MSGGTRIVEVRRNVLKANDTIARELRQTFEKAGVTVISVVSSPGSGKTAFLEKILTTLRRGGERVAALVGDLATDNDAVRLARSGNMETGHDWARRVISTRRWCERRLKSGSHKSSIFFSSRMSEIWCVRQVTILAKR